MTLEKKSCSFRKLFNFKCAKRFLIIYQILNIETLHITGPISKIILTIQIIMFSL
jgi:hypothetical protein